MRGIKLITFFLIIMFATPLFGYEEELENTLPILPGDSQETVYKKLGTLQKPGGPVDYFKNPGLCLWVHYDDNKNVEMIRIYKSRDVKTFEGKIFGISLEDSIEKCVSLWGEPDKIEETKSGRSRLSWTVKGFIIEIEKYDVDTYRVATHLRDVGGQPWRTLVGKKGEFKSITIKKGAEK